MSTLAVTHPTWLDLAKRMDPDNKIATIVEMLAQTNEILDDAVFLEGNLPTGHRTTARTSLPTPTWRKLNQGVTPTKSTTAQFTDSCGMLEAYSEVDKKLADLNGNTAEFRLSEDSAHVEGISQELANTMFYGNETTAPEEFTGFAPRFNATTGNNGENIITGGGAGSDNSSIWLIVWGPNTVHGIVPKGSSAGIKMEDKGLVTIESQGGVSGARMEAYRTHYMVEAGLTVRDWRYVVRICNIDKSLLQYDAASGADLITLMTRAIEMIPNVGMGRPAFYMPRNIKTYLRTQMVAKVKNSTLSMDDVAGRKVMSFDGIPCRRVDQLAADEALVS